MGQIFFFRGGKPFYVVGKLLDSVANPQARFLNQTVTPCVVLNSTAMKCQFPEFNTTGKIPVEFLMDGIDPSQTTLQVTVLPNPVFDNFTDYKKAKADEIILSVSPYLFIQFRCLLVKK